MFCPRALQFFLFWCSGAVIPSIAVDGGGWVDVLYIEREAQEMNIKGRKCISCCLVVFRTFGQIDPLGAVVVGGGGG